jgi:hypothetical protein
LGDFPSSFRSVRDYAMHEERFADSLAHLHCGVERGVWILKDHLHLTTGSAKLRWTAMRDVTTVEDDTASARRMPSKHGISQGALAGSGFPDHSHRFGTVYRQADVIECMYERARSV